MSNSHTNHIVAYYLLDYARVQLSGPHVLPKVRWHAAAAKKLNDLPSQEDPVPDQSPTVGACYLRPQAIR